MRILMTGASGFIGSRLLQELIAAGHVVVVAGRHRPVPYEKVQSGCDERREWQFVEADLMRDTDVAVWLPRLQNVDAVINAAGIFTETNDSRFDAIHRRAPQALFAAAKQVGIKRIIQISALSAEETTPPPFLRSKYDADEFLCQLGVDALILRPSLVFDVDGASAKLFMRLASLPWLAVPGRGEQMVQPVHRDDVCRAVVRALACDVNGVVAAVGPTPLPLRDYLIALRRQLGLGPALRVPVPMSLVRLGGRLPGLNRWVNGDALTMLEVGSQADATRFATLLGRQPRPVSAFLAPQTARLAALEARLGWLLPLLRYAIALVWLTAGVVSLGIFPVEQSLQLLAATGVSASWGLLLLYGAALFDLALGIATLTLYRKRWIWQLQLALILFYTVTISVTLPAFWAHPYGPLVKNLPMLAGILLLMELEGRKWNT